MKLPIVIQEHKEGYVIDHDFFKDKRKTRSISNSEFKMMIEASKNEGGDNQAEIPSQWKKASKRFSGYISGISYHIAGEADTKAELRALLERKAADLSNHLLDEAERESANADNITIEQIEV